MSNIVCPKCQSRQRQVQAGRTRFGSQRFFCSACAKPYTPQPKPQGHSQELRQQAVRLYVEGLSLRRIGRVLRVSPQSVAAWVHKHQVQLEAGGAQPLPPEAALACEVVELDELYTFVGQKRGEKNSFATS